MTSTDGQVNGSGLIALALVVGFIVAIMGCSFLIDRLAWALGRG